MTNRSPLLGWLYSHIMLGVHLALHLVYSRSKLLTKPDLRQTRLKQKQLGITSITAQYAIILSHKLQITSAREAIKAFNAEPASN